MTSGHKKIFKSIQVYIEKNGVPGPLGSLQAAELGHFGVSKVAPVEEKRIPFHLRATVNDSLIFPRPTPPGDWVQFETVTLHLPHHVRPAQHIDNQEIIEAIAVDVCKIHSHRSKGR